MNYYLPTKIILGRWDQEIKPVVESFSPKKLLLITDSSFFIKNPDIFNKMKEILSEYEVEIFNKVMPNPNPELAKQAQEKQADLIIGFGGGSVMDVAKVVAANFKKPCIEIPTTAGTGSEVTPFAALYTDQKKESVTPGYADVALVDYRLNLTMPKEVAASSGLDALSQGIEAYWSIYSTPLTDIHAERAIKMAFDNLEKAIEGDERSREMMSLAALEAGRAFSQTKTTAVHSVSYPFSIFYKIPHGFACALTLPYFLEHNHQVSENDCLDLRGPEFVKTKIEEIAGFLGAKSVQEAKEKIIGLMEKIGAPLKAEFDMELIIANGFSPERVKNNPREVTKDNLYGILNKIKI